MNLSYDVQEGRQLAYTDRPMRRTPFGAPDFQSMASDQLLVVLLPRAVLRVRHNLFSGTETLSLFVHEPIAIRVLCRDAPIWGRG